MKFSLLRSSFLSLSFPCSIHLKYESFTFLTSCCNILHPLGAVKNLLNKCFRATKELNLIAQAPLNVAVRRCSLASPSHNSRRVKHFDFLPVSCSIKVFDFHQEANMFLWIRTILCIEYEIKHFERWGGFVHVSGVRTESVGVYRT